MATLRVYDAWDCADVATGELHRGGSRSSPLEISVDGIIKDVSTTLATATSLAIWTSAEPPTTFDFFWLQSDQALKIELTVDRGGEVGSEELVFVHPANRPFRLLEDAALANYSGTLSGGTSDVIDEIVIRNESGSDANLRYVFIT